MPAKENHLREVGNQVGLPLAATVACGNCPLEMMVARRMDGARVMQVLGMDRKALGLEVRRKLLLFTNLEKP